VLLVDDDNDLRETVGEILRNVLGLEVLEARDGVEGVEIFRQHANSISLVILDVTMPRMRGGEAFDAMRSIKPDLPGILCSGFSEEMGTKLAAEHGFVTFLKKPFPLKELQEAIQQATGVRME
jgi:CheY-like chemotaxis protein